MYNIVIFDLDGTLLNTLEDLKDAVNAALRQYHYPERDLEEVRNFVGNGAKVLIERSVPEHTSIENIEKCLESFRAYYKELIIVISYVLIFINLTIDQTFFARKNTPS